MLGRSRTPGSSRCASCWASFPKVSPPCSGPGTIDDVPRAAAMRQRAWPDLDHQRRGDAPLPRERPAPRGARVVCVRGRPARSSAGRRRSRMAAPSPITAASRSPSSPPGAGGNRLGARGGGRAPSRRARDHDDTCRLARRARRPRAWGRLGFSIVGASSTSAVDPRGVEPLPIPDGVRLVPFGELDDPRPVYELDLEVTRDIPHEVFRRRHSRGVDARVLAHSVHRSDASLAAYVDGELAALTMIRIDRPTGRAQNNLAGTRRRYRGRGLATLVKSHSLRRAAELGVTIAITDNDETNAAMLAVNRKLGYRPFARRLEWERVTDAS